MIDFSPHAIEPGALLFVRACKKSSTSYFARNIKGYTVEYRDELYGVKKRINFDEEIEESKRGVVCLYIEDYIGNICVLIPGKGIIFVDITKHEMNLLEEQDEKEEIKKV